MITINVPVNKPYDVKIGTGILPAIGMKIRELLPQTQKVAIITDENVACHYLEAMNAYLREAGFEVLEYVIPPGEASKSSENYVKLQSFLAANQLTGTDAIIAFGGGVVGDLAGFVAATYLRGTPYVQVPTSLLAMVDSSVGGKTAIDLPEGKNLVGAFYQPALVLCDIKLLETLPQEVYHDGFAEIIKYGMLDNPKLLEDLAKDTLDLEEIVATCVTMKKDIVVEDEFDKGLRKLLNFGHTTGHAIEQLSHYEISHGQGVAIGMAMDTQAAVNMRLCPKEALDVLLSLLEKFQLPHRTPYTAQEIYDASLMDKKREGGTISMIIPSVTGKCHLDKFSLEALFQWIEKGVRT
ncbi:MAG: 3-dehydroquinate synthase [Turicibacter sp.]|nr:3-dehydroquinate synthase [Turicibacter sp.]